MLSFVKSDTIIVGKCWTMPHNYHTKEKTENEAQTDHIVAISDIDATWDGLHSIGQPGHNIFNKWTKHEFQL